MENIKVYRPPGGACQVETFIESLEPKLREMLVMQIFRLSRTSAAGLKEPHYKHFFIEKYRDLYELRRQVQMTAYNISGNNYVKLRDIGEAPGFNVYWSNGVQVDSQSPYTGEAPAQAQPQARASQSVSQGTIKVNSYKGATIQAREKSGLMISPSSQSYTVVSSNPAVVSVENVSGNWVAVAKASGTATVAVTAPDGQSGSTTITVQASSQPTPVPGGQQDLDLTANMDIRQEIIRLINQTRRANGTGELAVNEALMNAAQDCSTKMAREHDSEYECKTAMAYGYPHGFGSNLTWFYGSEHMKNVAKNSCDELDQLPVSFSNNDSRTL